MMGSVTLRLPCKNSFGGAALNLPEQRMQLLREVWQCGEPSLIGEGILLRSACFGESARKVNDLRDSGIL